MAGCGKLITTWMLLFFMVIVLLDIAQVDAKSKSRKNCKSPDTFWECDKLPRYYFDKESNECVKVDDGYCGWPTFKSEKRCETLCMQSDTDDDQGNTGRWRDREDNGEECKKPETFRDCNRSSRYYFDEDTKECVKAPDGQCGWPTFNSEKRCEKRCLQSDTDDDQGDKGRWRDREDKGKGKDKEGKGKGKDKEGKGKGKEGKSKSKDKEGKGKGKDEDNEGRGRECRMPREKGKCFTTEEKYFYNHKTGQCETSQYSGCRHKGFDDETSCINKCGGQSGSN